MTIAIAVSLGALLGLLPVVVAFRAARRTERFGGCPYPCCQLRGRCCGCCRR